MLVNPNFLGVDLPVYDSDTEIIYTPQQFVDIPNFTSDTFIRAVGINDPCGETLASILSTTDAELQRLAETSEVSIIEYEWGLWNSGNRDIPLKRHIAQRFPNILPPSHVLVAKVALIDSHKPAATWKDDLITRVRKYNHFTANEESKLVLSDIGSDQFMWGACRKTMRGPRTWLVDIEPRLKWVF